MRLGYACISIPMKEKGVFTSRTARLETLRKEGVELAHQLARNNLQDLVKIIEYNEKIGIRFFRLSSEIFPHMENPRLAQFPGFENYDIEFARGLLEEAGKLARSYGHRITMHPAQFAQLGSPRDDVIKQTIRDLTMHAKILLMMGLSPNLGSVMVIHGGGSYGDKAATLRRFADNFRRLPRETSQFIVLENDEFQYSVMDLLPVCEELGIPLCVDYFHHAVMKPGFDIYDEKLVARVLRTWKIRGIKPKCHWSSQAPRSRPGTHSDCMRAIPAELLAICAKNDCDIMIEAKNKDLCALKMYKKYFTRNPGRPLLWTYNQ